MLAFPIFDAGRINKKGIIIIKFTRTFGFYLRNMAIRDLQQYFHVVLEPSWSGYADPDILGWSVEGSSPVFVESTAVEDRATLSSLNCNLVPMSFGSSNWVDHTHFSPIACDKLYDSVYVANSKPVKRAVRYLKAVKKIVREHPGYRGALVYAKWGGGGSLEDIVDKLGIANNVEIFYGLNQQDLKTLILQSKTNILLSYKEGSNRSLFESVFAGVPVICLVENIGVNKGYINEFTGILCYDAFLEAALVFMKDNWAKFSPRSWALENISPETTTESLVQVISLYGGGTYSTEATLVKVNAPEMKYFNGRSVEYMNFNKALISTFRADRKEGARPEEALQNELRQMFSAIEKQIQRNTTLQ